MYISTSASTSSEIEITPSEIAPSAWTLLAAIRAATDAGRAFPDFPVGDTRGDDIEELAAELLIEPVDSVDGGWRAVAPE
jgi:hypothetical protein